MTDITPTQAQPQAKTISPQKMAEIEKTAKDFEAVFISEMMKPMIESVAVSEDFGGGQGEEMFRGMMIQEYGKIASAKGGFGLADHVKAQMIRLELGQDKTTPSPSMAAYTNAVQQAAQSATTPTIQESVDVAY